MNTKMESQLQDLLEFAKDNNLSELAWQEGRLRIAFRRGETTAVVAGKNVTEPKKEDKPVNEDVIRSPMVGIFRRSQNKSRPPQIVVGDGVKDGDKVAVVECMKIPTEVISGLEGRVSRILVEDGQPVEYGQPLFSVQLGEPDANGRKK